MLYEQLDPNANGPQSNWLDIAIAIGIGVVFVAMAADTILRLLF